MRIVEAGSDRRGAPPAAAQPFHEEEPRPSPLLPIAGCARKIGTLAPGSLAIAACLAAALWAPPAMAQSIIDLGTLGGPSSQATAINASGQVVGKSWITADGAVIHAFLYADGVMIDLGTLGGSVSYANGINDSGEIAGYSNLTGDTTQDAFLYSGGSMTDLGAFGGSGSYAFAINASGQIVGSWSQTDATNGPGASFLYSGGVMTDLGTLGGTWSYALGINASGQIVGYSWINTTDSSPYHGYLYSGGVMTDLGTLPYGSDSQANGINASGQVVGSSYTLVGPHAFLYSGGVMTDLGTLPGDGQGYSKGINASGQVVGYSVSKDGSLYRAFLYSGGAMIDLNSLLPANSGWFRLTEAYAINDFGQIAGSGIVNGATHAFLLNLTSLSPSSATAGGAAFTLKVTGIGTNFVPGATVNWNGTVLATTYVSATEMTASVPASLIAAAGTASVAVTTNEGTLAGGTFAIYAPRALPGEPERPRGTMPREQR